MTGTRDKTPPPPLDDADWLRLSETRAVFAALNARGVETRAVGGAVRNSLLGLPVGEIDLATTAPPEQVMALAAEAGLKVVPTGIEHGTVTVVADSVPFQVTTLRRDVETYGRHADVAFTDDWEEDARRRDFTLNALYADADGAVFDPLGGYADLLAGRVRFIGDPETRIKEDYLRILRFFRFQAYYGKTEMDRAGLAACVRLREGLRRLSPERIWAEFRQILVAPKAVAAIGALFDNGLLVELLGGVARLADFARLAEIEEAQNVTPEPALRLAALAVFVTEDVGRLAGRLRLSKVEQAVLLLGAVETIASRLPDETASRAILYRLGAKAYRSVLLLAWARSSAPTDDPHWRAAFSLPDRWQAPVFPLRGDDMLALGGLEGPEIGALLKRLEAEWIESDFGESREQLLAKARMLRARP